MSEEELVVFSPRADHYHGVVLDDNGPYSERGQRYRAACGFVLPPPVMTAKVIAPDEQMGGVSACPQCWIAPSP